MQGNFVYGQDVWFWMMERGVCKSYAEYDFLVYQTGRLLFPYIFCVLDYFTQSLADANIIRGLSVILLSLLSFLLFLWLRKNSIKTTHSLLLSIIIFTLPPFQVTVSNIGAMAMLISALAAALAGITVFKGISYSERKGWIINNKYAFLAILLLILSLLIYQASAMFYWVMIAILLINIKSIEWVGWKYKIYHLFFIPTIAIGIYFIYAKVNFILFGYDHPQYSIILSNDYFEKIKLLFYFLFDALNLWNIFPTNLFAGITISIILLGIFFSIIKTVKERKEIPISKLLISSGFHKYFLIICLIPLSMLPALATRWVIPSFRIELALTSLMVVILFWALKKSASMLRAPSKNLVLSAILLPVSLVSIYNAHFNTMNYFVFNSTVELMFIKSSLYQNDIKKYERIHIIHLPAQGGNSIIAPTSRYEFAVPIGNYLILVNTFVNELPEEKRSAVKKILSNGKLTVSSKENYKVFEEPTLVIDMTILNHFY